MVIALSGNRSDFDLFCQSLSILADDLFEEHANANTEREEELALARLDVLETVIDEMEYYLLKKREKR
jgi:hypothetical protein